MEVGDDRAAGEGPFGSIQGHGVAGARLEVGQLVLLLVALNKEGVSCHWKVTVDSEVYIIYVISSIFFAFFSSHTLDFSVLRIPTLIKPLLKYTVYNKSTFFIRSALL